MRHAYRSPRAVRSSNIRGLAEAIVHQGTGGRERYEVPPAQLERCPACGRGLEQSSDFCPHCHRSFND